MRRLFWLTVGAGLGGWTVHKVNETKRRLTPESVAGRLVERVSDVGSQMRGFADEVRDGAAEREDELNHALGRAPDAAVPGQRPVVVRAAQDQPAGKRAKFLPGARQPGARQAGFRSPRRMDDDDHTPPPSRERGRGKASGRKRTHNRKDTP